MTHRRRSLALLGLVLGACTDLRGSGVLLEEERELPAFDAIEVVNALPVSIVSSEVPVARLSGDDNIVPLVRTELRGSTLEVPVEGDVPLDPTLELVVEIGGPGIREVVAGGASTVTWAADLEGDVSLAVTGGATMRAEGSAGGLGLLASGGAVFEGAELEVARASVEITGRSAATARVGERVEGIVEGGSSLRVLGAPAAREVTVGGGSSVEYP